tara:strand:- start:1129 stop:2145 length:1017 start_codon:yes stop_codon:yes gene_type:complete
MNDFFNIPSEAVSKPTTSGYEKKVDLNLYDPNPDISGGVYKSVFRFIPNLRDKDLSKYTKYSAKIYNPVTKRSTIVDCPSNEGKPSILWTLSTILGKLFKEEPSVVKEINENFSRWYTHHSYIYVNKDPQLTNLEGSIKIFKYRAQINELLEHQINPEEDGLVEGVTSVNPFHLLEGKDFLCVVGKKTKTWRDWTKCKFMDEKSPFRFKIGDSEVVMKNEEGAIKLITEFFEKNAPSLDEYKHVPWTDDTYVQVAEALKAAIPYKEVLNMLISETRDERMKELLSGTPTSGISKTPIAETKVEAPDNVSFGSNDSSSTDESSNSSLEKDEYNDLFKDL